MLADLRDPSFIGALLFFDRAAKLQNFAAAAEELHVTPSAMSHRIAALEAALGKRLFIRETRSVRLTPEGAELAHATELAFRGIKHAIDGLIERKILRVSVGPLISSHWLMPRLAKFEGDTPFLRVELSHAMGGNPPRTADVSIVWTDADKKAKGELLFNCEYLPIISPSLKSSKEFWETHVVPIHFQDRTQWRHWLKATGSPMSFAERGEVLNDPNLVFEAAVHGRGVVMGMLPFILDIIDQGRVVAAHPISVPTEKNYRVVVADREDPSSTSFESWLIAEAAKTRGNWGDISSGRRKSS